MSETSRPESNSEEAKIIELSEIGDGLATFTIPKDATSKDVLATLKYVQPSTEIVKDYLDKIFELVVIPKGYMKNLSVTVHDPAGEEITQQASISRRIKFGEEPTGEDVRSAFNAVYGEEDSPQMVRELVLALIDKGRLAGRKLQVDYSNELATTKDDDIAQEMSDLTNEFYGFGGPTIE